MRLTKVIGVAWVALFLGLAGAGVLSGRLAVGFIFGAFVVELVWLLVTNGRTPEVVLDTVEFSEVVGVKASDPRFRGRFARVRLLVGPGTIATRVVARPRLLFKAVLRCDYTVRAADFQVDLRRTGLLSRAVGSTTFSAGAGPGGGVWDRSVVLSGPSPYGRGQLELQIYRSERVSAEEVERALIRAGARAVGDAAAM